MLNISQHVLTAIIAQLDSAISYHGAWFDKISEVLVCRNAPEEQDLLPDAHHNCKFGKWYYTDAHPRLRDHPAFIEIGPLHEEMHKSAAVLLQQLQNNEQIKSTDYQHFSTALDQLRLEITNLSNELQEISRQLDPLTGVYTRGGMLTKLRNDLEKVKRGQFHCSIIMVDIDNFKAVNDNYGHPVGDEVLHQVGSFLCNHIRIYDDVYRYGGEEFMIVMQDCDKTASKQSTERICELLNQVEIDIGSDAVLNVSASFGLYELEANTSVTESIARADRAMYQAKRQGKNCVVCWSEELD
jgi:diguanylate cyclase